MISQNVLSFIPAPLVLSDFLTSTLAEQDLYISTMSLQLLFDLLSRHGLDYPQYYKRLYALLAVSESGHSVFDLPKSQTDDFLKLLDLSLRSDSLPSRLVAAFAKRLLALYV